MAKQYETVLVVDAMIPEESIASEFDAVSKLIETQGKIVRMDRWGKRKLAYPIKKRSHGEYGVFYYEAETALPAELEKRLRINENVLRWLTVAENPCGIPPVPAPDSFGVPTAAVAGPADDRPRKGEE